MIRPMLLGAAAALAGAFPLDFALALTVGTPTLLDGWRKGYDAAVASPGQVAYFLLWLGFVPVGLFGAACGAALSRPGAGAGRPAVRKWLAAAVLLAGSLFAFWLLGSFWAGLSESMAV